MNGLDLFSGIGGLSIALRDYVRTVAYCENDPYCQSVLLSRMRAGDLQIAPIWDDINNFPTDEIGEIDIVFGGFPCQDISIAKNGMGLAGDRSGLFFQITRLVNEIRPKFIFLENVPHITSRGGARVVSEIASLGYDCRWLVISCFSLGAVHERKRWFLLAHSNSERLEENLRFPGRQEKRQSPSTDSAQHECWDKEPENRLIMAGMDDGFSHRLDRVRALGNAVVPCQAKKAFEILMGL